MKKYLLIAVAVLITCFAAYAQSGTPAVTHLPDSTINKESLAGKKGRDSIEKKFLSKATYPLIKSSKWSGVIPVTNAEEIPDPALQYKLLMEVTSGIKDSAAATQILPGFAEVGRLINLHIASGIPKKNLKVVMVVHGPALKALLADSIYQKQFKTANPNIVLLKELKAAGVKFVACGQAMYFFDVKKEDMIPDVKVSLTAQTVLSSYQLKGYVYYNLNEQN